MKKESFFFKYRFEIFFMIFLFAIGVYFRLLPRLKIDPHLLTFNADIWYRLAICQYLFDNGHMPQWSIRYLPYAHVPEWYTPIFAFIYVALAKLAHTDLPTMCSRILPFVESLTPLSFFVMARYLYGRGVAVISGLALSLTACFIYWNGIADQQSFISFMIPIAIMFWVWYEANKSTLGSRWLYILGFGMVLGVCFMTHLMYFLFLVILVFIHMGLVLDRKGTLSGYVDLLAAFVVSQVVTSFWWLPKNLYWWWTKGLVTSSGYVGIGKYAQMYGQIAIILGAASFVILIIYYLAGGRKKYSYLLIPVVWAIFPFIESENELILRLIHRVDLSWSPFFKPLEGFRFHPFLAQPFALCIGLVAMLFADRFRQSKKDSVYIAMAACIGVLLFYDVKVLSKFDNKMRNSGLTVGEYNAAVWFRNNSAPNDLITADYYKGQLIVGVCGAPKALDSLNFPLRNVDVKFISKAEAGKTKKDIYTIYNTKSADEAVKLMKKYGFTHVYLTKSFDKTANFGSTAHKGFGADIDRAKFNDKKYFSIVYDKDGVQIIKANGLSGPVKP